MLSFPLHSRLDFQELDLKSQSRVTGDALLFFLAIGHCRRNRQHSLAASLHANNALIPTFDDLSFTKVEILALGVRRGRLVFNTSAIQALVLKTTSHAAAEVQALRTQISDIYGRVNMDYEAGSRMILDAILLALGKTLSGECAVAILPEMKIGTGEGIQVRNSATGYELWLTGSIDYAVIGYKDELDNKERLLGVDSSRDDALTVAQSRFLLIEAKRQNNQESLSSSVAEGVGQAIAVAEFTSQPQVRFCLSNGRSWIFCILTKDGSGWVYYESSARHLKEALSEGSVAEIMELVSKWLTPTGESELYQLID